MVPEGWDKKNLQDIAKVTSGGTPSKRNEEYWGGDIPWVRTTEVQNCIINSGDVEVFLTKEGVKNSSAKLLPEKTILLAMIGQGKTRGQVALSKIKITTNQNCAAIILSEGFHPEFYYNFLLSQYQQIRNFSNSAGQSNLSGALVKSIKVPVPPLVEQQKIARILSTWDEAITTTEHLIEASRKQKLALMQQLLTGKRRLSGFEGEWLEHKLGDLFNERNESGWTELPLLAVTGSAGVIDRDDLARRDTSSEDKGKYKRLCVGDIGYNTMRMWQGVSGLSDKEGLISPAYTVITPTSKVRSLFAAYLFKFPRMIHEFYKHSQGLVSDTWNLKYKYFAEIKVKVPGIDEQNAIAKVLSRADNEIETLQNKLDCLKQEKKALMQQLLTGQRRVNVEEEAVA
ncbi:restriction endonuclease subunit S [Halomonas heilongjiangensis]|uniref:Restriction endonuclease subunit S n=1 Tax=Halomonas heilongjiangensis TaxID=1387883 RepID=A0A2N7TU53_9GAMM|nr:restriction endonuclease subunit S [Halomonas heilongjiangensis]PMR71706.1 restriction endonuclease subunit S [Halomonas heilongjiangensis]PXX89417.1 type I restriction endonuclease subunit S [Halomonas heilongjiangensis]